MLPQSIACADCQHSTHVTATAAFECCSDAKVTEWAQTEPTASGARLACKYLENGLVVVWLRAVRDVSRGRVRNRPTPDEA